MKNKLLGGVAAVLLAASAPALAAPPAPVFSWTGCYVGAHAGYGWGSQKWDGTSSGGFLTTRKLDVNGALYGGQIGCDYQLPGTPWVVGLDGSYSWSNIDGKGDDGYPTGYHNFSEQKNLGVFSARVGWAGLSPQHLIYAKGGWAGANFDFRNDYPGNYTGSSSRKGWMAGGGWEWLFMRNVSLFVEYSHIDLGTKKTELDGYFADIDMSGNSVKGGFNLRFGQ